MKSGLKLTPMLKEVINKPNWFSDKILGEGDKNVHFDNTTEHNNQHFYTSEKVIQPIMNSLERFSLATSHLQDIKRKFKSVEKRSNSEDPNVPQNGRSSVMLNQQSIRPLAPNLYEILDVDINKQHEEQKKQESDPYSSIKVCL